jgi:SAM-dependent methyltransferase
MNHSRLRTTMLQQAEVLARQAAILTYRSARLTRAVSTAEKSADLEAITYLRKELQATIYRNPVSAAKYTNHRLWLWRSAHRAARLGLHNQNPLRILDIGTGPGYFMAIAKALGHECIGMDCPETLLSPLEQDVYSRLLDSLRCRSAVVRYLIEPFKPLPEMFSGFDLITAFMVCFNNHRTHAEWGLPEWKFFIENAQARLRPGGVLFMLLNDNLERYGKQLRFYDDTLLKYFQSVGTVQGPRIKIRSVLSPRDTACDVSYVSAGRTGRSYSRLPLDLSSDKDIGTAI